MYVYSQGKLLNDGDLATLSLVEEPPTPDQFFVRRDWKHLGACGQLVLELLEDSFRCITGHCASSNLGGPMLECFKGKIALETLDWVNNTAESPYSFIWCCHILGLESGPIRARMIKSADYKKIELSKRIQFKIWNNKGKKTKLRFHGVLYIDGERVEVGAFETRPETIKALSREFEKRGGGSWAKLEKAA